MYYIIERLNNVNGQLDRSHLGYVGDDCDLTIFRSNEQLFYDWIENNKTDLENGVISIVDYIDNNGIVYLASIGTSSIEDMGLSLIVDINNPEGV